MVVLDVRYCLHQPILTVVPDGPLGAGSGGYYVSCICGWRLELMSGRPILISCGSYSQTEAEHRWMTDHFNILPSPSLKTIAGRYLHPLGRRIVRH